MNEPIPQNLDGMPLKFDYSCLSRENVMHVKQEIAKAKTLNNNKGGKVYGYDVFAIGSTFLRIRKRMTQQLFDILVEAEIEMSKSTASKYMIITRKFGHKAANLENLSVSILYELTFPSYPKEWLEKVLSGETVPSLAEVRQMRIIPDKPPIDQHEEAIREIERPVISLDTKRQITELEGKVQHITEENRRLLEDNRNLKSKLDRIAMTMKQIHNEEDYA